MSLTQDGFLGLGLDDSLLRALSALNHTTPTSIQTQAIPPLLAGGDLLGIAQTGTGKTAAFGLPLLQALASDVSSEKRIGPRALILAPTRELALQIGQALSSYGRYLPLRQAVIHGGVSPVPQIKKLRRGTDLLVATPGRLLDLLAQRHLRLDGVAHFVLDEADRMLDMGFIHDVRRIAKALPHDRQTMLFSATMPKGVATLAESLLEEPVRVSVTPAATPVERIDQSVVFVETRGKRRLLDELLRKPELRRAIVFTRTKHRANRVARQLEESSIRAAAIHGNKSQAQRQRALDGFRRGHVRVLVATDIAARGIDIDDVSHVINYELPNVAEDYVHRIGRTGRAGASGAAISLCDRSEMDHLRSIERLTKVPLRVVGQDNHGQGSGDQRSSNGSVEAPKRAEPPKGKPKNARRGHRRRHNRAQQRGAQQPRQAA